jgi:hypothetical protein
LDVFLYSGGLARGADLEFIELVHSRKGHASVTLILTTNGGNPDAAYKIGRYLQHRYETITVLVPGLCKSAGTLLATAASELAFTQYGELGPLDIQLAKTDKIAGLESGLSIHQAFDTLHQRTSLAFHTLVGEIVSGTGGVVSFQTASHSAAELVSSLYQPIFARIDPEEVGSRTRAMQIASHYGERLNLRFQNLKRGMLEYLVQTYPSHGFVIDREEACELFESVREATEIEKTLVRNLGLAARFPGASLDIRCLTEEFRTLLEETDAKPLDAEQAGGQSNSAAEPTVDGGDHSAATTRSRKVTNGAETSVVEKEG